MVYRAVKPKERMVPKGSPLAKTSSVSRDVGTVAKYVVPVAVGGGLLGTGAHALMSKVIPRGTPASDDVAGQAREGLHKGMRIGASTLLSGGAGAGLGALIMPRISKMPSRFGAGIGSMAAMMAANPAVIGREMAETPEMDPIFSLAPEKVQDFVRRHPSVGAATQTGLAAAAPIAAAYALRKYYPGTYARASTGARMALEELRRL
jgi:hypothetical protein